MCDQFYIPAQMLYVESLNKNKIMGLEPVERIERFLLSPTGWGGTIEFEQHYHIAFGKYGIEEFENIIAHKKNQRMYTKKSPLMDDSSIIRKTLEEDEALLENAKKMDKFYLIYKSFPEHFSHPAEMITFETLCWHENRWAAITCYESIYRKKYRRTPLVLMREMKIGNKVEYY